MWRRHSIAVRVKASHPDITENLAQDLKSLVFEGVRELLFNVVKHSGTDEAVVKLWLDSQNLVVQVEDSGRGIEQSSSPETPSSGRGFGLLSLRERLVAVGGEMTIVSAVYQGTTVTLVVPFEEGREDLG